MQQKLYSTMLKKLKNRWENHLRELKSKDTQAGASLIEILVAVAIIVILASAIGIAVFGNIEKAKIAMARQHITAMKTAVQIYILEKYEYPSEGSWTSALGPLLEDGQVPADPWGNSYIYKQPGNEGRAYEVISLGPDKAEGTDDDITSWNLQGASGGSTNGGNTSGGNTN